MTAGDDGDQGVAIEPRPDDTFLASYVRSDVNAKTLKVKGIRPGGGKHTNTNTPPRAGAAAGAAQFGNDADALLKKGKIAIAIMCFGIFGLFWSVWRKEDVLQDGTNDNVDGSTADTNSTGGDEDALMMPTPAARVLVKPPLAAEWNSTYDAATGKMYWYNTKTNAVQWHRPAF